MEKTGFVNKNVPTPENGVYHRLDKLDEYINKLSELTTLLKDKISPILDPSRMETDKDGLNEKLIKEEPDLVSNIRKKEYNLISIIESMRNILDMVAL